MTALHPALTTRPLACAGDLVAIVGPGGMVLAVVPRTHSPTTIAALTHRPAPASPSLAQSGTPNPAVPHSN